MSAPQQDPFAGSTKDPYLETRLLELFSASATEEEATITTDSPTASYRGKAFTLRLGGGWVAQWGEIPARDISAGAAPAETEIVYPTPFLERCAYFHSTGWPDTTWSGFAHVADNPSGDGLTKGRSAFTNGATAQKIINGRWFAIGR
jgi:hypothetical protein